ncbi:hypothetical protein VCJ_000091 [Vibrio metoecus]|nr:hypothetical protein VCJ_000091 [Vibrio metoecus]
MAFAILLVFAQLSSAKSQLFKLSEQLSKKIRIVAHSFPD